MTKIFSILILILLLTSSCSMFRKEITRDNLQSTKEAAFIKERATTISGKAEGIQTEAGQAIREIEEEVKLGLEDPTLANHKKNRWIRVELEAESIEKLSNMNILSGGNIIDINSGTWYATWWFKGLMIFVVLFLLAIVAGYITYMAKAWGVISYVKKANEGIAEGMAALIDKHPDIDNDSISNEEIRARLRNTGRYTPN